MTQMNVPRPEDCSHCSKPQSIHLTMVIDGQVIKRGVCKDCPHAKVALASHGFELIEGVGPVVGQTKIAWDSGIRCPSCGFTPADFRERGRLGCPHCYEAFGEKLEPILRKFHKASHHMGKRPQRAHITASPEEIKALKRRMEEYVSREEYELAAVVRDQLRSLEN